MIGRRTAVGLSLLCALLFSALATQSASAEKAINTTAFTCVKGGGEEDFEDPHCNEEVAPGTGVYGHVSISTDVTTEIEALNTTNAKFTSVLAGVTTSGICKTAQTGGFIHNVQTEGKHTVTGENTTTFSNCTVEKPLNCAVKEPIVVEALFEGAEGLGASKEEMGGALSPKNEFFVTISFENTGGKKCALAGFNFKIGSNGPTIGTGAAPPTNQQTGEANFTGEMTEETLVVGGKSASISVKTTMKMASGGNPISLTTVT